MTYLIADLRIPPQEPRGGFFHLVNGKVYPEIDDDGKEINAGDIGGPVAEVVFKKLKEMGFVEHHTSKMGGTLREADSITAGRRTALFLDWVHEKVSTDQTYLPNVLAERFTQILRNDYALLGEYSTYLETIRGFKPSTMVNHINDIVRGFKWFVLFKSRGTLQPVDLKGISYCAAVLNKNLKKALKGERGEVTMASEVYLRHQPSGGLAELQQVFPAQLEKLRALLAAVPRIIGKSEYLWFVGMLYTSFYVFTPQGRIGGLNDMRVDQYKNFRDEGHAETNKFKTKAAHGYQFVIVGSISFSLLAQYMEIFRPVAVRNFVPTRDYPAITDAMWITWDGAPDNTGPRITQWIRNVMGLKMSSNKLRSLVETTSHRLAKEGKITPQARAAVCGINGHTSQVARNYYVREDRVEEVNTARDALGPAMFNTDINVFGPVSSLSAGLPTRCGDESDSSDEEEGHDGSSQRRSAARSSRDNPNPSRLLAGSRVLTTVQQWPKSDKLQAADWGKDHPDYNKKLVKFAWSDPEITHIVNWCEAKVAENPSAKSTIVAKCLKALQHDPEALKIFHVHHVLDSARLRAGYRIAMKKGYFSEAYMSVGKSQF